MSLAGATTTDNAAIITIPATKQWVGSVSLSAVLIATPGLAAVNATPNITVEGTGVDPVAGSKVAQVMLSTPAISALLTLGQTVNDTVTTPQLVVTAPSGNAVTLVLHTGNATAAAGVAVGGLV